MSTALIPSLATPFDIQGHRGARGLFPENSLPGFAAALAMGATSLELDVAITADDAVVLFHDRLLNPDIVRGADGRYLEHSGPSVRTLTLEQIRKYDIGRLRPGTVYARRFPRQQPLEGLRIPTLEELVRLVDDSGQTGVRLHVETKVSPEHPDDTVGPERFAEVVAAELGRLGAGHRATIKSFDWRVLQHVQRSAPDIPTEYVSIQQSWFDTIGSGSPSPWTAGFDPAGHGGSVPAAVAAAGGSIWSPYYGDVDGALVREAHRQGLAVTVWTVNEPDRMTEMMDLGVDGIITDFPKRLRDIAAARGLTPSDGARRTGRGHTGG